MFAGCSAGQPTADPSLASPAPTSQAPVTVPPAALPPAAPWQPTAADVEPRAKLAAASVMETIGTWSDGGEGVAAAQARLRAAGAKPALAQQAGLLLGDGEAAVANVTYTQYFGYSATQASVEAIVVQSVLAADGSVRQVGDNFAVQVSKSGSVWKVTSIRTGELSAAAAQPSQAAKAVLANERIVLPAASRADVASGKVDDSVLTTLTALAKSHTISISVFISAHPIYVFGTDRRSDHPAGFAVDIGAIDSKLVVDPANKALVESVMRQAASLAPYQVGGPYDLDGGGSKYFTDETHNDHIHLGFR